MKRLIIVAHPSSTGFASQIAQTVKEKSEQKGDDVYVMNLYSEEWKQDFLYFSDSKHIEAQNKAKEIQAKISWADELVFCYPDWWSNMPGILKNFFDCNFSAGYAFQYSKNGFPNGLLKGKTARVFITAGTPGMIMFFTKWFITFPIISGTLKFCGIKVLSCQLITGMAKKTEEEKQQLLDNIKV